jgi:hypothetical protein
VDTATEPFNGHASNELRRLWDGSRRAQRPAP